MRSAARASPGGFAAAPSSAVMLNSGAAPAGSHATRRRFDLPFDHEKRASRSEPVGIGATNVISPSLTQVSASPSPPFEISSPTARGADAWLGMQRIYSHSRYFFVTGQHPEPSTATSPLSSSV